jgi:RES domain-containing protein
MESAWRIVLESQANNAFSGEGPWLYGGRWNSPYVRVVYASQHQSTAAFEVFINNIPFFPEENYKAFRLEWPDQLTEVLSKKKLPLNWRASPPSSETMEIGDGWVAQKRSAVLAVPSAICPDDRNFLLNPAHPDFKRIRIAPPTNFEFDSRLFRR